MAEDTSGDSLPSPGFVLPGIHTALEMALVATSIALVGLPAVDPLVLGVVLLAALVGRSWSCSGRWTGTCAGGFGTPRTSRRASQCSTERRSSV
jgi:hypothetical protein